jgi:hypothetical protein
MRKAEESLMKKGLVVAGRIPSDREDVPYTSESTLKVISPGRHRWNRQNWYSSKGRSGSTRAFGIGVCFGHFPQRPARRDIPGRNAKRTARYVPKANCTKLQKER